MQAHAIDDLSPWSDLWVTLRASESTERTRWMDFSATLEAVRALSVDERIELVQIIWDEIADECALPDLTDAQKAELDRRLASLESGPGSGIPWETVKAEIEAKLRR